MNSTDSIEDIIKNLSTEELYDLSYEMDEQNYKEKPVSIEEFITNDLYLGEYLGKDGVYKYWIEVLKKIYPSPFYSGYWMVIIKGAIGLGKTTIANIMLVYDLYKLMCLKSPQSYYSLIESTKILMFLMNNTLSNVSDVGLDQITQMFSNSEYFRNKMRHVNKKNKNDTMFPNRIDISVGSKISHALGRAIFSVMIDEVAFNTRSKQAYDNFNSVVRRMESRFMGEGGGVPGKVIVVSSESDNSSDLNKIANMYKDKEGVLIIQEALWTVKPDNYTLGKWFKVFVGSDTRAPEIIRETTNVESMEEALIIDVPEEHRSVFESDINMALRDIAGVSTGSSYALFKNKDKLYNCRMCKNIFKDTIVLDFDDDNDSIESKIITPRYFDDMQDSHKVRFIHIDIGISGDRLGIACSYVKEIKQMEVIDPFTQEIGVMDKIFTKTDWAVGIEPVPGKQVPLYKIRQFIKWLSSKGVLIAEVTLDGYQSTDTMQSLKKMGFTSGYLSVDRTADAYITLRNSIYSGTHILPNNMLLIKELEELELQSTKNKVDHQYNDPNKACSKDIADGVSGSMINALNNFEKYILIEHSASRVLKSTKADALKSMFKNARPLR